MKKLLLFFGLIFGSFLQAQDNRDVIMQAFYWNTFPGDFSNTSTGGVWWDSIATKAPELAAKGFKTVYGPPPTKAVEGIKDCGFAMTDYYDFGNFSSTHNIGNGLPQTTTRTRYGNFSQFQNSINTVHANGMKFMMDIILNHRGGGTSGTYECRPPGMDDAGWTWLHSGGRNNFNFSSTPSGRVAVNNAQYFHPNNQTCDVNEPLHQPYWAPDISFLTYTNNVLINGAANNGWYYGNSNLSGMADSLVIWGRYLHQNLGIDEFRMDAAKHMEPEFTAAWAVELKNGTQPYIAMENADLNESIRDYLATVHTINTTKGKTKNAAMSAFDFNLKGALEEMSEGFGAFDMALLNRSSYRGLYNIGVNKDQVVTFVQNHDHDRGGFRKCGATEPSGCPTRQLTYNGQCLEYYCAIAPENLPPHNAVDGNKHLAYAYILAAPGRPTIFWKDYYWYGFNDDIDYLMAIRRTMIKATDEARSINELNPWGPPSGTYDTHSLNMVYRGPASGEGSGILVLNDHGGGQEQTAWVDTYFANKELKDYTDAYPFETITTYDDGGKWRGLLKAKATNYAYWAPTGRYPTNPGTPPSQFGMTAAEGGKIHWIVLRAADKNNFLVGGSPIQVGDEIAVKGSGGIGIAGIGRVGQTFKWDGVNDMVIEVLGNGAGAGTSGGRLGAGESIQLAVKRSGMRYNTVTINTADWLANGTAFTPTLNRPSTRPASPTTVSAAGTWVSGGRSVLTKFATSGVPTSTDEAQLSTNEMPSDIELSAVYPNPFAQNAEVSFRLKTAQQVQVSVVDALGRTVAVVWEGKAEAQNETHVAIDGTNLSNGVYFLKIAGETFAKTQSFTVLK